jgi:hypothetical protein
VGWRVKQQLRLVGLRAPVVRPSGLLPTCPSFARDPDVNLRLAAARRLQRVPDTQVRGWEKGQKQTNRVGMMRPRVRIGGWDIRSRIRRGRYL